MTDDDKDRGTDSNSREHATSPRPAAPEPTRRSVVQGGGAIVLGTASGAATRTLATGAAFAGTSDPPTDAAVWLLNRASFGLTPETLDEVHTRGLRGWVDWQLDPAVIDDSGVDARLSTYDWIGWSAEELFHHPSLATWQLANEFRGVRLVRATYSKRQLFERVVEFWSDHFNIFGSAGDTYILKIVDDREVIREHALGRFSDLLHASAKSPAMLAYLDNDTNVVGAAQENYAREVMELHTLGADGPYTEVDVRELARCFTGWTYQHGTQIGSGYGTFEFRAQDHDLGPKSVLGQQIPAGGGISDAEQILDFLAVHPKTVDFVTTKLAKWFYGESPPQSVIDDAKAIWVQTQGSIEDVVRSLLSPHALRRARPWDAPKFKRPFHWSISMFRATGIEFTDPTSTTWQLSSHGDLPFRWGPPNGYPDTAEAWASGLIGRWRDGSQFANGWYWSIDVTVDDLRPFLAGVPMAKWSHTLSDLLCGGSMTDFDRRVVQAHVDSFAGPTDQAVGEAFEIAFASPSFQTY